MKQNGPDFCPPEILEWIAWYPDGGLTDEQRGSVESHAAACVTCRDEIAMLAGYAESPVAPADPERLFARVLALVEAEGLAGPPARAPRRRTPAPRRAPVWSSAGARLAASVALLLLAGLAGWLGNDWLGSRANPVYATASASAPLGADGALALDVVFRGDVSARRIQTALRGLGAELVAGPSPLGRYRVELPPGADASAAAALLRAEGTGVASFAEPLRR